MRAAWLTLLPGCFAVLSPALGGVEPVPFQVAAAAPDVAAPLSPAAVHLGGWLGERVDANAAHRLLDVDTVPLLAGFRAKPGSHAWIGEHIGKWLHAATLAWAATGDPRLKAKLDGVVTELCAAQEPDGYLGTYLPAQRFGLYPGADWDVWSHKYNLLGLLTWYRYTGDERALLACRKMGDLLVATFPAQKSILAAGTHVGMAATSVLEPMVLLYRLTGEERYLQFARYLVTAWNEPHGPRILDSLLATKRVDRTANGKAYELLSNLVGLAEFYRLTGEARYLAALRNAWQDIVAKRLYLTGSASHGEHFGADFDLPNGGGAHICETCVTVTWIQLNLQLLCLTGEARFGDELERAYDNHLTAAQHPNGEDWCYYTALEGRKHYDQGITCCHSSGPRGLALAPQTAYLVRREGGRDTLLVNTLETSRATLTLGGQPVTVEQASDFPRRGAMVLTIRTAQPATFAVQVRAPAWARPLALPGATLRDGWAALPARPWRDGDRLTVRFTLLARRVAGDHGNDGREALTWGPFVLAVDQRHNPRLAALNSLGWTAAAPPLQLDAGPELAFTTSLVGRTGAPQPAVLVPFAAAGTDGGPFRVWLRAPGVPSTEPVSLLVDGQESRSRPGNVAGSSLDDDPGTFVVTYNGQAATEDWYAVTLPRPVTIARVLYAHGQTFHDGGWFDASGGRPRVQVQRLAGGPWETVGELADYPATTATDSRALQPGQTFTLVLPAPLTVSGLRVAGRPASGDSPQQAFSSCAELQALGVARLSGETMNKRIGNGAQWRDGRPVALAHVTRPPVERHVIYRPSDSWTYSHHQSLAFFQGRFHAIWSNGRQDEDAPGQRVLWATSADFEHWTTPRPLVDSVTAGGVERVLTAAGFHQHAGTLVAYFANYGPHKETTHLQAVTSTDGETWSAVRDIGLPVCPNHPPQTTASGRLILAGNISFPWSDDPMGLAGWHMAGIYSPGTTQDDPAAFWPVAREQGWPTALCEGAFYQTDDQVLHMLLRATGDAQRHRLWLTESRDDGATWSGPVETEFSDTDAKFHFGRLPDGRFYYVGNPIGGGRTPLVLSLSTDGVRFEQHFILGEEAYQMSRPGRWKGGEYGYPHTLVHDGYLYVIVSRQKEGVEVMRVALPE